jgi:hypothetical protein
MTFISTKLHLSNTEMFFLVHLDVYNEISQIFNRLENSKENYLERHPATHEKILYTTRLRSTGTFEKK